MAPVETGIVAPVETGNVAPCETGITVSVETRSGAGCPDSVQPQTTPRCVNRRLRRSERTTATASRRSTAFRAQDGWRRKGGGTLEKPRLPHRAA